MHLILSSEGRNLTLSVSKRTKVLVVSDQLLRLRQLQIGVAGVGQQIEAGPLGLYAEVFPSKCSHLTTTLFHG